MSLTSWLSKVNPSLLGKYKEAKRPGLPNPNEAPSDKDAASWAAANSEVEATLNEPPERRREAIITRTVMRYALG